MEHEAVNLSQGFTDEPPLFELVWGGVSAVLAGEQAGIDRLDSLTLAQAGEEMGVSTEQLPGLSLKQLLAGLQGRRDQYNQYSQPFGLPELRSAISAYTSRFYGFEPDPDARITVTLGATEGLASVMRAVCSPGDEIVIFQPFHEMYPSQAELFGLKSRYVTLREDPDRQTWAMDRDEVDAACRQGARALVLNTPHNPTGKVFQRDDLEFLATLCQERDLFVFSDEIYEHIVYDGQQHVSIATLPDMSDRTFVINSVSKTGRATGWRVGWVISPEAFTEKVRAVHDTLVIQAPTALQKGTARLLDQPENVFRSMWKEYDGKRTLLVNGLRRVGFEVAWPEGSYYLFANYRAVPGIEDKRPMDAAMFLITQIGVASVPGDVFYRVGSEGDDYLRFAFCRSMESLEESVRRLERGLT